MRIIFFGTKRRPVAEFIGRLPLQDQAKILSCLKSVEECGLSCPRVEFRQIDGKLWEIKIRTSSVGYRIFYVTLKKDIMILLHAYKKQSPKAPIKEIEIAQRRLMEVLKSESLYFR